MPISQCTIQREDLVYMARPEFGTSHGQKIILIRSFYGLKSNGAAWRAHLMQMMVDLEFDPCQADLDVWMQPTTKENGFKYYEYILIYVDDILCVSAAPESVMKTLLGSYQLKEDPSSEKGYAKPKRKLSWC